MKTIFNTNQRKSLTQIIIEEFAGIDRVSEPVTMGIPIPEGLFPACSQLSLEDPVLGSIPVQVKFLSTWADKSPKWVLLDFQVSVNSGETKELELFWSEPENSLVDPFLMEIREIDNIITVDTGAGIYCVNTKIFKPFESINISGNEILNPARTGVILTDEADTEYLPHITNYVIDASGPLRTTLRMEGVFKSDQLGESGNENAFAAFCSSINFYSNNSTVKIDFTLHNPQPAIHPGGLWDLGDDGSIYFKDLSAILELSDDVASVNCELSLFEDPVPMDYRHTISRNGLSAKEWQLKHTGSNLLVYQDSSGGNNWKSRNHFNKNGDVKTSFRGFRVYKGEDIEATGYRANPIISVKTGGVTISAGIQYFWQNFPKALGVEHNVMTIGLFPDQFKDIFELQGGEQKTHTFFMDFNMSGGEKPKLAWIQRPLIPKSTSEYYTETKTIPYLTLESENSNGHLGKLLKSVVEGHNTFFARREIIDEYGWRNFGELYADHESVLNIGDEALVSHYNNQYDCIYGALFQFLKGGDQRWFILADQLCRHVKDIDIYHTDEDRPEYNRGLFWHSDHYLDAQTATHRCFSKINAEQSQPNAYGGGPSLSHNYSTGFLFHYFLTGDHSSNGAVRELGSFVENNINYENTIANQTIVKIRKLRSKIKNMRNKNSYVQLEKIYGLDGPSRTSGNALNTLIDAFLLTRCKKYMSLAEKLIRRCIHPCDDIGTRDLLDIENRWMYTIFLQSLAKYLDAKRSEKQFDTMWFHARESLVHYAEWIAENEHLYLEKKEKLEHPNETWAAQDIRKCNILLQAANYADSDQKQRFTEKANSIYRQAVSQLFNFSTHSLTRPIAVMMQNAMVYDYHVIQGSDTAILFEANIDDERHAISVIRPSTLFGDLASMINSFSLRREIQYIKWRV